MTPLYNSHRGPRILETGLILIHWKQEVNQLRWPSRVNKELMSILLTHICMPSSLFIPNQKKSCSMNEELSNPSAGREWDPIGCDQYVHRSVTVEYSFLASIQSMDPGRTARQLAYACSFSLETGPWRPRERSSKDRRTYIHSGCNEWMKHARRAEDERAKSEHVRVASISP
jgi:hypothetical protein